MTNKIKWGADPEFFAGYKDEDGIAVLPPVYFRNNLGIEFKENGSHPIFKDYEGTLIHEDGAAFEMSTPPSNSWRTIWDNIHNASQKFSNDVLSKFPGICEPGLLSLPTIKYDVHKWAGQGPEFHLCTIFGCDPDHDVYDTKAKKKIIDARKHGFRYAGGHIHMSGIPEVGTSPLLAIRSMVITAGLASIAYSDVIDLERGRLFLYGKPGKFRPQKYGSGEIGIEYRTPSTRWTSNLQLAERVFSWAEKGIKYLLQGGLLETIANSVEKDSVAAILECDQQKALDILAFVDSKL